MATVPDRYRRLDAFLEKLKADIYPEPPSDLHGRITREMFQRLAQSYSLPPGGKVLDVGCGQGVALEVFKQAGLDPIGVTLGEDAAVCRAKGLEVVEADFAFLDFEDGRFDLVWCRHALEHSLFPFFTLAEMHRVLKPGGLIYVEVPAPDTACAHQTNRNHYSVLPKSMWIELMKRVGFPAVADADINFTTQAGPDTYWVFVARKPAEAGAAGEASGQANP